VRDADAALGVGAVARQLLGEVELPDGLARRQGRVVEHRNFTLYFADGKVTRWEGDEMPESIVELNRSASAKALPSSAPGEKSAWERFLDVFHW